MAGTPLQLRSSAGEDRRKTQAPAATLLLTARGTPHPGSLDFSEGFVFAYCEARRQ